MEKLSHIIEKLYQSFILTSNEHYFFKNIDYTIQLNKNIQKSYTKNISGSISFNKSPLPNYQNLNCYQTPSKTKEKDYFIDTYYKLVKLANTTHKINTLLDSSLKYLLPASIPTKEKLDEFLKEKKDINILVYGGGPSGLFVACYLTYLFNSYYSKTSFPKIKVLLIDNRSPKTGFRYPFNRNRVFYVGSDFFKILLSDMLCVYKNKSQSTLIKIKYLEQMLYLWALSNNVPMYFDPDAGTEEFSKNIIQKGNFNLVFDCTGNRLPTKFSPNPTSKDKEWLNNLSLEISEPKNYYFPNKIGKMTISNNLVKYKFKTTDAKYYLFIEPYLNGEYVSHDKSDLTYCISNKKDVEILKKLSNKCISLEDYLNLITHLHSQTLRKIMMITSAILTNKKINLKLYLLDIELFHKIKITKINKINNHKFLYIGLGDTIFSGHFVMGQGLARLIPLIDKIVHLIPILS